MNLYELTSRVIEALEAEVVRWCDIHQTSGQLRAMLDQIASLL